MELRKVKLNELISPNYNPRKISSDEMHKLKRSITELGYAEPIIVNDVNNVIISGNQRYKALKDLGTEEIEVIFIHEPVLAREKALNVALNKIDGDWDHDKLKEIIIDVEEVDSTLTGFEPHEIELMELETEILEDFDLEKEYTPPIQKTKKEDREIVKCPECGYEMEL